jgi:hypothetical protein
MMRLAVNLATERGVRVIAPVHDALLIEAPIPSLDDAVKETRRAMAEASRAVLDGFTLRTDVKAYPYPDRYRDERGQAFWTLLMGTLARVTGEATIRHKESGGTGWGTRVRYRGGGTLPRVG